MGSCISPIIANLYIEHIEHTAITTFHTPPSLWLRYVDDTLCILDKKHVSGFHSHLNSICSHIQFTIANEHNFSLSFLDVLVSRNVCKENYTTNTSLTTAIYKKSTHTDRYLHYTSHHPKHQKLTVTKTLLNRDETHISHTDKNQKKTVSYGTYVLLCNLTNFLPELLFSLAKTHALKLTTLNSNNSLLFRMGKVGYIRKN